MPSFASADHEHGQTDTAPAANGTALPRFAAVSETFELVGLLDGKQITLYLDRYADNTPVRDAQIELEIAGTRFKAEKADGEVYRVTLQQAPEPGELPIQATVSTGTVTERLAGEIDLHEAAHAAGPVDGHAWQERAVWIAGGLLALGLLAWGAHRLMAARQLRSGGAA